METLPQLTLVDSSLEPAAHCLVCGKQIPAGEGVTARYLDRTFRFKCPGCYARFAADPQPYLAGQLEGCCDEPPVHSHDRERDKI